jgi:hypothetical protein
MSSINPSPNDGPSSGDAHPSDVSSDLGLSGADLAAATSGPIAPGVNAQLSRPDQDRMYVRGDRIAVVIYRFIEARSRTDLLHVFNAARAALAAIRRETAPRPGADDRSQTTVLGLHAAKVAVARASLEQAALDLRRVPSRREYDRWRSQQPRPEEFATATFIRRAFRGSWVEATAELDGLSPDVTARRLLQNGQEFSLAQMDRALEMFAAAVPHGERTQHAYMKWATDYVRLPGAFDVPLNVATLTTRFGLSWSDLLEQKTGERESTLRSMSAPLATPRARSLTAEEKLDCVRMCARELKLPVPTALEFDRWARCRFDSGGRRVAQHSHTIAKSFGGWAGTLFAAGLLTQEQRILHRHRTVHSVFGDEALRFVAAALRDRGTGADGAELTRVGYANWRCSVMLHPEAAGLRVPSGSSILGHAGMKWNEAVRRARGLAPSKAVPPHWHLQRYGGAGVPTSQPRRADA